MNIYLNVNGVLLTSQGKLAPYAGEFLSLIVKRWPNKAYWLTLQSRGGRFGSRELLKPSLDPQIYERLSVISPGDWQDNKTDAIDFTRPFLWYDDFVTAEENQILRRYDAQACLRLISLDRDPHQLLDEIEHLRSLA